MLDYSDSSAWMSYALEPPISDMQGNAQVSRRELKCARRAITKDGHPNPSPEQVQLTAMYARHLNGGRVPFEATIWPVIIRITALGAIGYLAFRVLS